MTKTTQLPGWLTDDVLTGWNDYLNDPNSLNKLSNAIMARDDLLTIPRAAGGIDSKASSISTLREAGTMGRVGPTYSGEGFDAFC
ncbi:hypothetical protein TL16_g03560 [Triparma laevis f. inornata]|uniref:Phospholipase B-like n=2 Tax=Triparma laevis TaxID=1534972 RepID=A0A9W7AND6_9STRA|nr:hypothetical protein TL16_g03560 [Triparma laevis f. inornata]GMH75417.1 hypothetical protein TrLO_g821 [Triparma laevis f. longispina]